MPDGGRPFATMANHRAMWKAQREAQGARCDDGAWQEWLFERWQAVTGSATPFFDALVRAIRAADADPAGGKVLLTLDEARAIITRLADIEVASARAERQPASGNRERPAREATATYTYFPTAREIEADRLKRRVGSAEYEPSDEVVEMAWLELKRLCAATPETSPDFGKVTKLVMVGKDDVVSVLCAIAPILIGAETERAAKVAEAFCWNRYKGAGYLAYSAVFTSHTWQEIGAAIRARSAQPASASDEPAVAKLPDSGLPLTNDQEPGGQQDV